MKMKKTSKIMALVLAVTMVLALMPIMMVSAATIDPVTGIGTIDGVKDTVANTVTFTVPYTMVATEGTDQVTLLVTEGSAVITYLDEENTQPSNIRYIDQVPYSATSSFTFVADIPEATATYYVKVGGTDIATPASAEKVITIDSVGGFTVSGYVDVPVAVGSTVTLKDGTSTTTDATGRFEFTAVTAGTYDLKVGAKSALLRTIPVSVVDANVEVSVSTNKITLMFGDTDSNGKIELDDLMAIKGTFNKLIGAPEYNANYDLDSNGKIELDDLMAIKGNFNKLPTNYLVWSK